MAVKLSEDMSAVIEIQNLNANIKAVSDHLDSGRFSSDIERDLLKSSLSQSKRTISRISRSSPIDTRAMAKHLLDDTIESALLLCVIENPGFKEMFSRLRKLGIKLSSAYREKSSEKKSVLEEEIKSAYETGDADRAEGIREYLSAEPFIKKVILRGRSRTYGDMIKNLEMTLGWISDDPGGLFSVCCEINDCDPDNIRRLIKKVARMTLPDAVSAYSKFRYRQGESPALSERPALA